MAYIRFDRLRGTTHVLGEFELEEPVIGFGKEALDMVLTHIHPDNHFELRALYSEFRKIRLVGTQMSFYIDAEGETYGVSDLKACIQGQNVFLGCYFVFAEGGGADGLVGYARQLARWAA